MATVSYEADADRSLLADKKVAILGYGSQGHAHALNLADSGIDVRVGLREGSSSKAKAEEAGLKVAGLSEASAEADVIMILLPDTEHEAVFNEPRRPQPERRRHRPRRPRLLVRFGYVTAPEGVDVALVAPKGPGHLVRRTYTEGGGVPALIAVAPGRHRQRPGRGPGLRRRHRRQPGRRARHHLRGGDRDRPVRRAGRPLRRPHRPGPGRVRDPGRGRVPARVGLLRVPPRAEADRRPHVRAGHRRHALLDLHHRRVRRPHPRPPHHHPGGEGRDEEGPGRDPERRVRQGVRRRDQGRRLAVRGPAPGRQGPPDRDGRRRASAT